MNKQVYLLLGVAFMLSSKQMFGAKRDPITAKVYAIERQLKSGVSIGATTLDKYLNDLEILRKKTLKNRALTRRIAALKNEVAKRRRAIVSSAPAPALAPSAPAPAPAPAPGPALAPAAPAAPAPAPALAPSAPAPAPVPETVKKEPSALLELEVQEVVSEPEAPTREAPVPSFEPSKAGEEEKEALDPTQPLTPEQQGQVAAPKSGDYPSPEPSVVGDDPSVEPAGQVSPEQQRLSAIEDEVRSLREELGVALEQNNVDFVQNFESRAADADKQLDELRKHFSKKNIENNVKLVDNLKKLLERLGSDILPLARWEEMQGEELDPEQRITPEELGGARAPESGDYPSPESTPASSVAGEEPGSESEEEFVELPPEAFGYQG